MMATVNITPPTYLSSWQIPINFKSIIGLYIYRIPHYRYYFIVFRGVMVSFVLFIWRWTKLLVFANQNVLIWLNCLYRCGIIVPYNEGKCTLQMIIIVWCDSKLNRIRKFIQKRCSIAKKK